MSSFWWQDLGLDFLAQADVWSAGIQEWRLKVKIPLVASPESPDSVLWAVCCRTEGRGHSIPSAMRVAPACITERLDLALHLDPVQLEFIRAFARYPPFFAPCRSSIISRVEKIEFSFVQGSSGLSHWPTLIHIATSHFERHMAMMLIDTMSWNQDPPFWSKISEEAKAGRNIVRVLYSETRHSWRTSFRDASVECPASV